MKRLLAATLIILTLACTAGPTPTSIPTPTPTPSPTPILTPTPTPTPTPVPTATPLTLEGDSVVHYPYSTPPPNSIVSRRIVVGTRVGDDGCSYTHSGMGGSGTVIERELAYNPESCESLVETILIPAGTPFPTPTQDPAHTPDPTPTIDPAFQMYMSWMADLIGGQIEAARQNGMPEVADCLEQLQQAYIQGSTVQQTVEERCDPILSEHGFEFDR